MLVVKSGPKGALTFYLIASSWRRHVARCYLHKQMRLGKGSAILEGVAAVDVNRWILGSVVCTASHSQLMITRASGSLKAKAVDGCRRGK